MDAELAKILDAAGLTGDDRAKAEAAFSIEGLGKIVKDGVLMRSDYSRKMDELTARQRTLEANWQKANEEYLDMQKSLEATQAQKDAAETKLREAEQKLTATIVPPTPPAPVVDETKFLTKEQHAEELKKLMAGQTAYFGDTLEAQDRINALTGTRVPAKEILAKSLEANKTPMQWAEETYQLAAKAEERDKAAREKELKDAEDRGYQRHVAEQANPQTRVMESSKDPFYVPKPAEGDAKQPWDLTETPADEQALLTELNNVARA